MIDGAKIAAVVVLYHPDLVLFQGLIRSIVDQVDFLLVVDNGQDRELMLPLINHHATVHYHELSQNYGLGFALNFGFSKAIELGANYIATFDQDSVATHGMIFALLQSHMNLKKDGILCAAVSPIFYDLRERDKKYFPVYQEINGKITAITPNAKEGTLLDADYLITSGMLIDTHVWSEGIRFDERFFIDYTDVEWCFRSRAMGYKMYVNCEVEMGHTLSDGIRKPLLSLNILQYSPIRRYYFYRNVLYFCKLNYVPPAWSRRLFKSLLIKYFLNPMVDTHPWSSLKMMTAGIIDGILGNLGPR